jgi:hypothetical protein
MSISAMKQALEALERGRSQIIGALVQQDQDEAITALRQAIAEAEKQEPVAWREVAGKTTQYYDYNEDGRGEPLYLHREWVGLDGDIPGLGLVTEEFYNGMLCAEDILRRRNT